MYIKNKLRLYIMAKEVVDKCREKNYKLSIAESCTGGLISSIITSVPGSSDIFDCSFITYSNDSKSKFLGVSENTLSLFGSVSKEVVVEMANGLMIKTNSDIFLAISGIAGPGGGSNDKPEGLVWISYGLKKQSIKPFKHQFGALGREKVREKSAIKSLEYLKSLLED